MTNAATGVHVVPIEDVIAHDSTTLDCVCGPDVEWIDPETGAAYPSGPLVLHHSLDGRELKEPDYAG